jgi:hypothetical protein
MSPTDRNYLDRENPVASPSQQKCRVLNRVAVFADYCGHGAAIVIAGVDIGLVLPALSDVLPLADLFLAASVVAKYTAPGLTKSLLARMIAPEQVNRVADMAVPAPAPAISE